MVNSQANKPHKSILLIVIVTIEIVILSAMLLYAAYLILGIQVLKIAQKSNSSLSTTNNTSNSDCPAGKDGSNRQGENYKILGLENISVDGHLYNLCCSQSTSTSQEVKVCSDKANGVIVMYSKVNGQFILANEMFTRDGKKCTKYYQDSTKSGEICL